MKKKAGIGLAAIIAIVLIALFGSALGDRQKCTECRENFTELLYSQDYEGAEKLLRELPSPRFLSKDSALEARSYAITAFRGYQSYLYDEYERQKMSNVDFLKEGKKLDDAGLFSSLNNCLWWLTYSEYPLPDVSVSPVPSKIYATLIKGKWDTTEEGQPIYNDAGQCSDPNVKYYISFINDKTISYYDNFKQHEIPYSIDSNCNINFNGANYTIIFFSWDSFRIYTADKWIKNIESNFNLIGTSAYSFSRIRE